VLPQHALAESGVGFTTTSEPPSAGLSGFFPSFLFLESFAGFPELDDEEGFLELDINYTLYN